MTCQTHFYFKLSPFCQQKKHSQHVFSLKGGSISGLLLIFFFSTRHFWGRNQGFRSYVECVLSHSTAPKITKFQIHYSGLHNYKSYISQWLAFAIKKECITCCTLLTSSLHNVLKNFKI